MSPSVPPTTIAAEPVPEPARGGVPDPGVPDPGGAPGDLARVFDHVLDDNRQRLMRLAAAYADGEERRDLFQEILLQIWRGLPSFAGRARLKTWVYRVALNTALTYRRRDSLRARHRAEVDDETLDAVPVPAGHDDTARQLRVLRTFLRGLSKVDRALLLLYLEDLSYREISEVLGIGESNVGVKIHRLKKRFSEQHLGE